ncbi:MAG: ribonuclease J [Thermodesulfobacteriota bacterium]|nr:ribonuclease J [Thermodesulfobacteriota bacterium]
MSQVKIIPLGGVREFGLNSTIIEGPMGSVLIDAGLMFPNSTSTGIDQIIPDFSYVLENQEAFQGILLTHGHEDHIGALPYLLKDAPIPVYGHPFTLKLVERKLREYDMKGIDLIPVEAGDTRSLGGMEIGFMDVIHSTLGCFAISINTSEGMIVHSGDFKYAPEAYRDLASPIRLFMCESTNAEIDPKCSDEDEILGVIDSIVAKTSGAVVVSTFSSHVSRIKHLCDIAKKHDRKVSIMGRSMNQVVDIASDIDLLDVDPGSTIAPDMVGSMDRSQVMIICTGTQGETYSALSLISKGWHRFKVKKGDSVIVSARIIPGNELAIGRCIDQLLNFEAKVYYSDTARVHASGHATHDEIRKALRWLRPEILMPVHGEYRHMKALEDMGSEVADTDQQIVMSRPGQVWTLDKEGMHLSGDVPHGKCFVDGELTGDIKDVVLRDRRHISEGGFIVVFAAIDFNTLSIVIGPEIMCKGVVPASMEMEIMDNVRTKAMETIETYLVQNMDLIDIKARLKENLGRILKARLGKKPMIISVLMEI